MKSKVFILILLYCPLFCFGQFKFKRDTIQKIDSSSFVDFYKKKIFYADLGFNTAPFSINFKDSLGNRDHLYFRNNSRPTLGIGFSYKWLSLRVAFNVFSHLHPISKFGKTSYLDLGLDFKTKRHFYDIDLHNYQGYALKNAYNWNDTLDKASNPHLILPLVNTLSLSVNTWRFFNKNINMSALKGKTALYLKKEESFYLKTTFNLFGVGNSGPIIPLEKFNPYNSKTGATTISAFDFGILPGYVYVNRYQNWQYSGMFGFGPVIQSKFYFVNQKERVYVGLAPRVDIRILIGYNKPKYFINLVTEFDNKSIRFRDLTYRQTYYSIKLVGGIRLD